ncbi:MAG: sialate O-acetylesterase [Planctomycetota bacterium]
MADAAAGGPRLGAPFTDHMVIQAEAPVRVWGWDEPGQTVRAHLAGQAAEATANATGYWLAELPPVSDVGPYELQVTGSETLILRDVVAGEVWWCSGQSNMRWPIRQSWGREWVLETRERPEIRLLKVPDVSAETPQPDTDTRWQISRPDTLRDFSAVAYFFAHELQREIDRPVGVIQAAWGGSKIRAWLPPAAIEAGGHTQRLRGTWSRDVQRRAAAMAEWEASGRSGPGPGWRGAGPQHVISGLYHGMTRPFEPLSIRGVLWYQGESDAWMRAAYAGLFTDLVASWRQGFRDPELPVFFVQLPNFAEHDTNWADFRNAQRLSALALDGVDMAVTIDVGQADDIHPPAKQPVGQRLAWLALEQVYGRTDRVAGSPRPVAAWADPDVPGRVLVTFDRVGDGLHTGVAGGPPMAFGLSDASGRREAADAAIVAPDTVAVSHPAIPRPVEVRYAHQGDPPVNLVNSAGLPATPFVIELEPTRPVAPISGEVEATGESRPR